MLEVSRGCTTIWVDLKKEREGMKRRSKLDLFRAGSPRALFSLAVFSLTLVGFGAIAYAVSIPAVLANPLEVVPVSASLFESQPENTETSETSADAGSTDASGAAEGASASGGGTTFGFSSLMGGPTFSSIQAILNNPSGSGSNSSAQDSTGPAPHPNDPSNEPPQSGSDAGSSSTSNGLSAEVEEEIHAHLLACYANLKPYYDEVCAGYENLYSTMNSNDPSITHVSCAPTDASSLLSKCDQGRIRVSAYRYNGNYVLNKSKWYGEAQKLSTCFNDLTNACSALRTVSGFTVKNAPGKLAPHLNSNGEVRYLAECRARAATISL